jgi:phosphoribosylanthranilate isomerase
MVFVKNSGLKIKVCGMRDAENIRQVLQLNPDFIGFILYPGSKRFVGDGFTLPAGIPKSTQKVGVFVNDLMNNLFIWKNRLFLDAVQLHGEESPEYCMELNKMNIPVIKAFSIDDTFNFTQLEKYLPWCQYFLFDTRTEQRGGSGRKFDWKLLKSYPYNKPFMLSGGIGPEDATAIRKLESLPIAAVDINSCFEDCPGIKNIEKLKVFFNALKTIL